MRESGLRYAELEPAPGSETSKIKMKIKIKKMIRIKIRIKIRTEGRDTGTMSESGGKAPQSMATPDSLDCGAFPPLSLPGFLRILLRYQYHTHVHHVGERQPRLDQAAGLLE